MLNSSTEYTDLLKSQYRPKCEPIISVFDGNNLVASWEASDIVDLKLTRGIDPLGRTHPYINLEWTEICTDKLDISGEISKYANVTPLMTVRVYFVQNLQFTSTWKNVYNKGQRPWSWVYTEGYGTWKEVYEDIPHETFMFPTLFLTSKPIVENNIIRWSAKDFFGFLTTKQSVGFYLDGVRSKNVLRRILLEERANFKYNKDFIGAIENTSAYIRDNTTSTVAYRCIFESETNNILKNMLASKNFYFNLKNTTEILEDDFGKKIEFESYAKLERLSDLFKIQDPLYTYTFDFIKEPPQITKGSSVSTITFKRYKLFEDKENTYTVRETETTEVGNGTYFVEFELDETGYILETSPKADIYINYISNRVGVLSDSKSGLKATIVPCKRVAYPDYFVDCEREGEAYEEDNDCCFGKNTEPYKQRRNYIEKYFQAGRGSLTFEGLPNLALELGDRIRVETNLYDLRTENRIFEQGFLIEQEFSYNGALTQKNTIHEV